MVTNNKTEPANREKVNPDIVKFLHLYIEKTDVFSTPKNTDEILDKIEGYTKKSEIAVSLTAMGTTWNFLAERSNRQTNMFIEIIKDALLSMENFISSKDGDYAHLAEAHHTLKNAVAHIDAAKAAFYEHHDSKNNSLSKSRVSEK